MTKKKIIIITLVVIVVLIGILLGVLVSNKTFFKNTYTGTQGQEIFIPKYSYFKNECCMTAATFYSFKSEKQLKKEIDNYMKDFEHFEDETTYGYRKDDLFIQNYEVINKGIIRKIVITY